MITCGKILVFLVNKTQFHKHIIWVPSLENLSSGLALRPCLYQKDPEQKGARAQVNCNHIQNKNDIKNTLVVGSNHQPYG